MPLTILQTGNKSKKSVKLKPNELKRLSKLRDSSLTDTAFSRLFDVDRVSLLRIVSIGSGSESNINKIRHKLSQLKQSTYASPR